MIGAAPAANDDTNVEFDRMTEEDLLRGLDGLVPPSGSDDDAD
jgi:DNA-directed RNA polymerase subunit omega